MDKPSTPVIDHLARIVARKRHEVARRVRRAETFVRLAELAPAARPDLLAPLYRNGAPGPRVIAEIKLQSPSAGIIRPRVPGELPEIARGYQQGGAAAVSVLCDGPGFGGSPLDARRVAARIQLPVLFKEFVIDPVQVDLARAVGASYVLLLVRVLDDRELAWLIREVRARGLEPVVEAADADELTRALATEATIIGVNARDLRSFTVDPGRAGSLVDRIPADRLAVFMSGVRTAEDYRRVAQTRADAVLIGEGLMRAPDPGAQLARLLRESGAD
ncbi:MAG: Indole-3-glycerol phosphate synthase [Myxococcaceae bacterium]|nr:Indole-3-glycerol phosphate synthase [Myxococcaceae bacterium]